MNVFKADVSSSVTSIEDRFARFLSWEKLVSALSTLRHVCASFRGKCKCTGWHICKELRCEPFRKDTDGFILRSVQTQAFREENEAIKGQHDLPKNSRIQDLSPYIDEGLLRFGGRLNNLRNTGLDSVNPVIIPGGNVATLLIHSSHNKVFHQGRTITEGTVRSQGFWSLGAKRLISSIIYACVICRKLRRKPHEQKMADLPLDRIIPGPPFSSVGLYVFSDHGL